MKQLLGTLGMIASLVVAASVAACDDDDDTCEWGGETYEHGESFPAGDGCNTCQCGDDGTVSCTLLACVDAGT